MYDNREDYENRPRKHLLTREDRQKLVQRHFEAGELRQAYSDLNLLAAHDLGARLRAQGED